MRVWTDGTRHLAVGPQGLVRWQAERAELLRPLKRSEGSPARDVLALVSAEPLCGWWGSGEVRRLGDGGVPVEAAVLDAVGLPGGEILACVAPPDAEQRASARLVKVNEDDHGLGQAVLLEIPAPVRIEWPNAIWDKGKTPWPEEAPTFGDAIGRDLALQRLCTLAWGKPRPEGGLAFDRVIGFRNEHGVAFCGAESGLVVVIAPDGSKVEFALRVPTQASETEIFGAPTPEGVLVVVCAEGHRSAILHLGRDGAVLAHRSKIGREAALGMGPPLLLSEKVFVLEASATTAPKLHELERSSLKVKKSHELALGPTGELSTWGAPEGKSGLLGLGAEVLLLTLGGRGRLSVEPLPKPAPADRRGKPVPIVRAEGAPMLAFVPHTDDPPWRGQASQKFALRLSLTNRGGSTAGVALEVGGEAVSDGLVEVVSIGLGKEKIEGTAKASFREHRLSPGFVVDNPKNAPPFEEVPIVIELLGKQAGTALLTVRASPMRTPGKGSTLQGRSLVVTA